MSQKNQIQGPHTTEAVVLASTAGHGMGHLDANARDIDPFFQVNGEEEAAAEPDRVKYVRRMALANWQIGTFMAGRT